MSFPRPVIYPDLTQFLYVTVVLNNDHIHTSFIYHKLWSILHNLSPKTNVCLRQSSEPQSLPYHPSTNLCCFTPALAHQWWPRQDSLLASHVCPHWPLVLVLKLTKEDSSPAQIVLLSVVEYESSAFSLWGAQRDRYLITHASCCA